MSSPGLAMVANRNDLAEKQRRTYRMKWIIKLQFKLSGSEREKKKQFRPANGLSKKLLGVGISWMM